MTDVWLAEKAGGQGPADVLGIFSKPERAREACQYDADDFFGSERTPALSWLTQVNGGYSSASYHHPEAGMFLFQVTRFTVDEVKA